jgi:hypothetical protein
MTRLITFTDENMTIAADICCRSALSNNVQEAKIYGMDDIDKDFKQANKEIFAAKRGPAYWLWKPYLIDRELKQMNDGDILIYSDAGVEFVNNVNHIIDRMDQDVWLFGNMWEHVHWCKGDVFNAIKKTGPFGKQVQASLIFIRNSEYSRKFIAEWLYWCQQPGLIDDSPSKAPNNPEFQEHRHDQAILTTLARTGDDWLKLHWWPAMYNAGNFTYEKTGYNDDYPVLFHHHRMRNEQFSATDELNQHMQQYFFRIYPAALIQEEGKVIKGEYWFPPNEKRLPA